MLLFMFALWRGLSVNFAIPNWVMKDSRFFMAQPSQSDALHLSSGGLPAMMRGAATMRISNVCTTICSVTNPTHVAPFLVASHAKPYPIKCIKIYKFYGKYFATIHKHQLCCGASWGYIADAFVKHYAPVACMLKSRMSSKTARVDNYNYYYDDMVIMYA